MSLGTEIKQLREAAGLSQQALADAINASRAFVGMIEQGRRRRLGADCLFALCRVLGVAPGHFARHFLPGVELTGPAFSLPEMGIVPAGRPIEVAETPEVFDFAAAFGTGGTYVLRVRGESMVGDGIADGDRVVVEPADDAEDRETVVALVDGEQTVKRIRKRGREIWLEAANELVPPIRLDPRKKNKIIGIVIGVVRVLARGGKANGKRRDK